MITVDLDRFKRDVLSLVHTLRFYVPVSKDEKALENFIERSKTKELITILENYITFIDEDIERMRQDSEKMKKAVHELVSDKPDFNVHLLYSELNEAVDMGLEVDPELLSEYILFCPKETVYEVLRLMETMGFVKEDEFHFFTPFKNIL